MNRDILSFKCRESWRFFSSLGTALIRDTKAIIINRPGSVTTPCCKLKQQVFLFLPSLPIRRNRFLFYHSTLVRLRRGRSRRHSSSSSSSSRSLQLRPHHECFECRYGFLVVLLLILCDTWSVAALLLVWLLDVGMYLLHSSCRDHRAF